MLRAIKTFFVDPPPVENYADIVTGLNVVNGIAKVEEPLRSPVRGENCVAFFYRSFLIITGGRNPQPVFHKIKQAEVYAPFTLEVNGGTLHVIPRTPGTFQRETHQLLQKQYGPQFQGVEEIVAPGARVQLRGRVRIVDGKMVMKMSLLTVLQKKTTNIGVVGDRKARRQKKK